MNIIDVLFPYRALRYALTNFALAWIWYVVLIMKPNKYSEVIRLSFQNIFIHVAYMYILADIFIRNHLKVLKNHEHEPHSYSWNIKKWKFGSRAWCLFDALLCRWLSDAYTFFWGMKVDIVNMLFVYTKTNSEQQKVNFNKNLTTQCTCDTSSKIGEWPEKSKIHFCNSIRHYIGVYLNEELNGFMDIIRDIWYFGVFCMNID